MGKTAAQQNSGPEGDAAAEAGCVSSDAAEPRLWTCSEKFSAPFALVISWVSEVLNPSRHTQPHTQDTHSQSKNCLFSLCNTLFIIFFAWKTDIKHDHCHWFLDLCYRFSLSLQNIQFSGAILTTSTGFFYSYSTLSSVLWFFPT